MFRETLATKPDWLTLWPAYPYSHVVAESVDQSAMLSREDYLSLAEDYGHYDVALPTGTEHGISVLYINLKDPAVRHAAGLVLGEQHQLAVRYDNQYPADLWVAGPATELEGFCLSNESGVILAKFYNGEPVFFDSQVTLSLPHTPSLSPFTSQLLPLMKGALLSEGVSLKAEEFEVGKATSHTAREVQCRLYCAELLNPLLRGDRTLKECLTLIRHDFEDVSHAGYAFLYQLVFDRIERHHRRLPLTWADGLTEEDRAFYDVPFTREHQVWSYEELHVYMRGLIAENLNDQIAMTKAVRECLVHMANADIDSVQTPLLLKFLASQSGLQLSASALKRQLMDLQQSCDLQTHADIAYDMAKSLRMVTEYRYHNSRFWRWDGSHWVTVEDGLILYAIGQEYGHLQAARRAGDHHGIKNVLSGILKQPLKVAAKQGINLQNGFLDTTLTLHEHHPDFGQTHTLDCEYHPDQEDMPMFRKFLHDCWGGDADFEHKVDALQEMMAVTLFGLARQYQRAFLLYGVPKSGKSQMLNIMSHLVPVEGKCSVNPADWHDRFRPALMANKILNMVGELSERKQIDGQKFKDIIDGTEQTSEFKGRDAFQFVPSCAHWFASNHLPRTRDSSEGFNRRWLILTFNQPVPEGATIVRDLGMLIVSKEREAIVSWAAKGIGRVLSRSDFTLPASHHDAVGSMASQNNSLAFFILGSGLIRLKDPSLKTRRLSAEDRKRLSHSKDFILGDTLYSTYSQWCVGQAGVRPVSSGKFHTQMKELAAIHGFIQNRIRYRSGLLGYSYVNLECGYQSASETALSDPTLVTSEFGLN